MKKIALVAALAVVTACSQAADEADTQATEEVVEEAAAPVALDGGSSVGTYSVTGPDGSVVIQEVREDGTFTNTMGEETSTGTWEQPSPDQFCTTSDEEGAEQECSTESMTDEGVWESVDNEGETYTVERVAEEEEAAE